MESLYDRWKKREDPNDFDDILLKSVRDIMLHDQKLIMLSMAEARPWDTSINVIAIHVKSWNQIVGYYNDKFAMMVDDYYTEIVVEGEVVTVHRLSLHEYITKLLEGEMNMYFAFRWWARAWFIDVHMRQQLQRLHQYCMSKDTLQSALWSNRLLLDIHKARKWKEHDKISHIIFTVGAIKILLHRNVFPKDHYYATEEFNRDIVDDALFGRYDKVNFDALADYIQAQIKFLYEKVETTDMQKSANMPHISGAVHQLRLTYAIK